MREIQIFDSLTPVTEAYLARLESKFSVILPADYRSWLKKVNGGQPIERKFEFGASGDLYNDGTINWFLTFGGVHFRDAELVYTSLTSEKRLPLELLPIADEDSGNLVCIAISGKHYGRVFFWDHEFYGDATDIENFAIIADSFESFLDKLSI